MNKAFGNGKSNEISDSDSSSVSEHEVFSHKINDWGFYVPSNGQMVRSSGDDLYQTLLQLHRIRTRLVKIEVKPSEAKVEERVIYRADEGLWKLNLFDRIAKISALIDRDPAIVGFNLEYHNYSGFVTTSKDSKRVKVSLSLYVLKDFQEEEPIPASVTLDWIRI